MRSMPTTPDAPEPPQPRPVPDAPDPDAAGGSGPAPGERRLAHPPSDRYRAAEADEDGSAGPAADPGSVVRGLLYADLVALVGAGAIVVLGGVLAQSAGLLVVAALIGRAVALALLVGVGPTLGPPRRTWLAVGIALGGIVIGQVGLWAYAGAEGGVLPLPTYLAETFGLLVPLQLLVGAAFAWWSAR